MRLIADLKIAWADELSDNHVPADELVEGVLVAGESSIIYGDSNSGKTFFGIDLSCCVADGHDWMGRRTERGLVIYLATESPASVKRRLQAYQKHHKRRVPNFCIVQAPINLFASDTDTDAIIDLVKVIEAQRGQRARLIVGDTMARLVAGGNENSGEDMGLVVARIDRIRAETGAHFCLIHHSGKVQASGARGWSGVKCAIETEIEITSTPAGRAAEITKQRDLPTKGDRIGFRLDVVSLGKTKWGKDSTSCIVSPAEAPNKSTGKKVSEVGGAILEFLRSNNSATRVDIVNHFKGQYDKSGIYRQIKTLTDSGTVSNVSDLLSIVQ